MTQPALVFLEADDEITAVVRRVRSADASRVIVVAPGRSRATSSAVALRLLARAGTEAQRDVLIVGDGLTRSLAAEAGLPAFASVDEARSASGGASPVEEPQHATIHVVRGAAADETVLRPSDEALPAPSRGEETRPVSIPLPPPTARPRSATRHRSRRAGVALGVLGALLVAGVVAGMILLPAATITITARTVQLQEAYELVVEEPRRESGTVESSVVVTATEPYEVLEPATGTVTFRNFNSGDVEVPAETLVAAGTQAFETTETVVVPAGSLTADGTIAAGEADAPLRAAAPGPDGNVGAETIDTVLSEGVAARLRLFPQNSARLVINAAPTAGGADEGGVQVSEEDLGAAVDELRAELERLAGAARPDLGDLQVVELPPAEPSIDVPDDLVGTRDVAETEISGTLAWEVLAFDPTEIEAAARDRLASDNAVPDGHELLLDSVEVQHGAPVVDGEVLVVPVDVTGAAASRVDEAEIRQLSAGRTESEAEAALASLGSADVVLWPGWVASVPELDWRVDVRVEDAGP